jgi:hypothetical protein
MVLKRTSLDRWNVWDAVRRRRTAVQIILPFGLATTAFLIDLKTPGEIADGFFYVLAVLSCVWIPGVNAALSTALGLMVPMILGFFASPSASASQLWTVAANRILGIILSWLVALVVWRISRLNQDRERTLIECSSFTTLKSALRTPSVWNYPTWRLRAFELKRGFRLRDY